MTTDDKKQGNYNPPRDGEALIIENRIDEVEREQAAAKLRDEEYKNEQLELNRALTKYTRWLAFCAVGSLLVAAVAGGISWYQAKIAKISADAAHSSAESAKGALGEVTKGSTDTHQLAIQAVNQATSTNDLAKAALRTAKAQESQLDITRRMAKLEKGADLIVPNMGVEDAAHPGYIQGAFTVQNGGKSPAIHVRIFSKLEYRKGEPPDIADVMPTEDYTEALAVQDKLYPRTKPISRQVGSRKLYLHGTVWYVDEVNGQQWQQFCARILPPTELCNIPGSPHAGFCLCSSHQRSGYK